MGRHTRIKKVVTKSGAVQYFLGDGLWFGRVGAARAEQRLASGEWTLFETVNLQAVEEAKKSAAEGEGAIAGSAR